MRNIISQIMGVRFKEWGLFLFYILLILCFIYIVGPLLGRLPLIKPLALFIEANDIDAGALYYTDMDEFSTSEINLKNTLDYMPQKPPLHGKSILEP